MASRMAPPFRLSQPPQRSAVGPLVQDRMGFVLGVAALTLSGCQYVSGAADLKVDQRTSSGMAGAGTSGQGGGGSGGGGTASITAGEPGTTGPWDCVGEPLRDPGSGEYVTSGTVSDLNSRAPVASASISACRSEDEGCMGPTATTTASAADGSFTIAVTRDFQGYFRVAPPEPFIPAIVQLTTPISLTTGDPDIVLFQKVSIDNLARAVATTIDPAAGHAFFSIADCNGELARDISVKISSPNAGSYVAYYLADNSIPTTGRTYTGQQGGGGFVNMAPGLATFEVVKFDTDERIASVVAPVRAGVTTFFQIQPH
jgi:hypothetical protein